MLPAICSEYDPMCVGELRKLEASMEMELCGYLVWARGRDTYT